VVKSNTTASLSKAFRNVTSLRLQTIKSPATKVLRKNAKISAPYNIVQKRPRKMYSASNLSGI